MKLAIFEDRYSGIAGAQENLLILGEGLVAQGHEVTLFTNSDHALAAGARERGLGTVVVEGDSRTLHLQRSMAKPTKILFTLRSIASYSWRLGQAIRAFSPDLVLASAVRSALFVGLSRPLHRAPLYLFAQNSVPLGILGLPSALLSRKILLIADACERSFPGWSRPLVRRRSEVLHSGRDPKHWNRGSGVHSEQLPEPSGAVRLLTLCSIVTRKGVHDLIDAVQILVDEGADIELVIGGADRGPREYCQAVREAVVKQSLPVRFTDWVDDPRPLLQQAEVFVLASYDEGLPGVLIEAMSYSLPCVTTNAGGAAEAVEDGKTGFVVPVGEPVELANALRKLVESSELRSRLGLEGRRSFEKKFTSSQYVDRFLELVVG